MPPIANPTEFNSGEFGNVEVGVTAESLSLAGEYAWQVVHTGYTVDGAECLVPVWISFNQSSYGLGPGKRTILLSAGQVFVLPPGTTTLWFILSTGTDEPILNLISSKPGGQ